MKIEEIRITVAEEKHNMVRTGANIIRYDINYNDQSYVYNLYHTYEINGNHTATRPPLLNIVCSCPRCYAEFEIKVINWEQERDIEMVCVCGIPLLLLPDQRTNYERPQYL